MTEKENNMYQTILNLSQVIQDQQKEVDLWKAIIKERDKTITVLHEELDEKQQRFDQNMKTCISTIEEYQEERKDLQKALDEQIEVSANLREQLNDARKIIDRIRQYAENHCKL